MAARKRTVAGSGIQAAREGQQRQSKNDNSRAKFFKGFVSGWGTIALALLTAIAGLITPKLWSAASDSLNPPVAVTVSGYDDSLYNSRALPHVLSQNDGNSLADQFFESPTFQKAPKVHQSSRKVTVEGKSSHIVVVTGIRARIIHRAPPISGTLIYVPPPQGNAATVNIGISLDDPQPIARSFIGSEKMTDPYFRDNYVTLTNGEAVAFQVTALARKESYEWSLEIDLVVDGKRETRTVQPPDGPFRTTAFSSNYAAVYEYDLERRSWARPDPKEFCRRQDYYMEC